MSVSLITKGMICSGKGERIINVLPYPVKLNVNEKKINIKIVDRNPEIKVIIKKIEVG